MITFKIITPHSNTTDYHHWWWPNGYQGVGPTERRDRAGRRPGKRTGCFPEWFVLGCNNTACPARALVPVSVLTDLADRMDPETTP